MATRKIRNTTISNIFLTNFGNQTVKATGDPGGDDIFTFVDQETIIKQSTQIFNLISSGDLIVLDADDVDIVDTSSGWNWLVMENIFPTITTDGDWHVVNQSFGHVTGNKIVNWTVEQVIRPNKSFSEKLIIPNGRTMTINCLEGGSSNIRANVKLEWFEDNNGTFIRRNPEIRVGEIVNLVVNGAHSAASTVITVFNVDNELDLIETGLYYGFKSGSAPIVFHKIQSISKSNDTITLDVGLTAGINDNTQIALIDRVIGHKQIKDSSVVIEWVSPPQFVGNGVDHLLVTFSNDDDDASGLITATVNGWHTDSTVGG